VIAQLSPATLQALRSRFAPSSEPATEQVIVQDEGGEQGEENVNAEGGSTESDRYAQKSQDASSDASIEGSQIGIIDSKLTKMVDVFGKRESSANIATIVGAITKSLRDKNIAPSNIGPAMDSSTFAALISAVKGAVPNSTQEERRIAIAKLVDPMVRPKQHQAVMSMELRAVGTEDDKCSPLPRAFPHAFATALGARLQLSDIKGTGDVATIIANLFTIADALDPNSDDSRIQDIIARMRDLLHIEQWMAPALQAITTRAQLQEWFNLHESTLRKRGGDGNGGGGGGGGKGRGRGKRPRKDNNAAGNSEKGNESGQKYTAPISSTSAERVVTLNVFVSAHKNSPSHMYCALGDTGATKTLIDATVARRLNLPIVATPAGLTGATTTTHIPVVGLTSMWIHFNTKSRAHVSEVQVVENAQFPIILSAPLLLAAGAIIDGSTGAWRVRLPSGSIATIAASAATPTAATTIDETVLILPDGQPLILDGDIAPASNEFVSATGTAPAPTYQFKSPIDEVLSKIDTPRAATECGVTVQALEAHLREQLGRLHKHGLLRTKNAPGCDGPLPAIIGAVAHIEIKPGSDTSQVSASMRRLRPDQAAAMQAKIDELVRIGVMKPISSDEQSIALCPAFVIPKRDHLGKATGTRCAWWST
jgi:hypothetical protein